MKDFLKKLTSRKFLAALAGIVTGLSMIFGLDENIITSVAGAVTALGSVVVYVATEGKIDAEAVKQALQEAEKAKDALEDTEDGAD